MSGRRKNDYDELERQYVQGTMSMRALCREHGIKAWTPVFEFARRNAWEEKREQFAARVREEEARAVAIARAGAITKGLDDAIRVANRAIFAFLDSLEGRWETDPQTGARVYLPGQTIVAADFVRILDKLMVLSGQPSKREAHVGLNLTGDITDPSQLPVEVLRDIVAVARERGATTAGPASPGSSPLPRLEGARQVN